MTLGPNDLLSLDTNVLVHWIRQNDTGIQLRDKYRLHERTDRPIYSSIVERKPFWPLQLSSLRGSSLQWGSRSIFIHGKWCPMTVSLLDIAKRADQFFMQASPIHEAMRRLTKTLDEMQIRFAIAGAMAANAHGYQRTTTDVDILIRREDLQRFKQRSSGLGWVDRFEGSKGFRDTVNNVNIDALIVGDYPGDGLPKPVAFPPPESVAQTDKEGSSPRAPINNAKPQP